MAISEPELTPEEIKRNERRRIRKERLKSMAELTAQERKRQSAEILRRVKELDEYKDAKSLFCFLSLPEEADTLPLVADALATGKEVYVPFCIPETKNLGVARITDPVADVTPGILNIPEPRSALRTGKDPQTIDFFIISGVAFDHELTRLGHGAGYFDRFLAPLKGKRPIVAVAFDEQICPYAIPRFDHDINPDKVVTSHALLEKNT